MTRTNLEERVALLEKTVAELSDRICGPATRKDWRSTVGMFAGDPVFKEISEEGRRIREVDRQQAEG